MTKYKTMKKSQIKKFPHLKNSPIVEALIDIQVSPGEAIGPDQLKLLHEKIKADYPVQKTKMGFQASFQQKEGTWDASATALGTMGYLFFSQDEHQVVQYRRDGFTFSRLKPYQTWKKLRNEAKRLWDIYSQNYGIKNINRVAVRYVDLLEIPAGSPVSDFIKNAPKPIQGGPSHLTGFLNQQRLLDPDTGIQTILTLSMEPPPNAMKVPLIIDSDVFKVFSPPPNEKDIWGLLENFRELKNNLFFGIITSKAVEEYK